MIFVVQLVWYIGSSNAKELSTRGIDLAPPPPPTLPFTLFLKERGTKNAQYGSRFGMKNPLRLKNQQAGAELCQAQVLLEVVVEIGVEFGVEVKACHY